MVEKAFWRIALLYQMKLLIMWVNACRNTRTDQSGKKKKQTYGIPSIKKLGGKTCRVSQATYHQTL